jgi:hypothetical protein
MRCVLERFHSDLRFLAVPNKTLKAEGFFKSNKVKLLKLRDSLKVTQAV